MTHDENNSDPKLDLFKQGEQPDEQSEMVLTTVDNLEGQSFEDAEDDDLLQVPKGALLHIYEKLAELEEAVEEDKPEQDKLEQRVQELEEKQQKLETETNILHSRADHISEFSEDIDDRLEALTERVESKTTEVDRRITMLEERNRDTATEEDEKRIKEATSESRLERLSTLDESTLEDEFSVDIQRAIKIYNNFEEWSSPTSAGKRLKSGELKKLLSAKTDDGIAWTQLYRAMEKFDSNTDESYELIETKSIGKALVKRV